VRRLVRVLDVSSLIMVRSPIGIAGSVMRDPLNRSGVALAMNVLSNSLLGFVFWIVAARLYPVENVGVNAAFIAAMQLVAGVASLNLHNVIIRFVGSTGQHAVRLVGSAYLVACALAVGGAIAVWIIHGAMVDDSIFSQQSMAMAIWFVLATAAWAVFTLQDAVLVALRRAEVVLIENTSFGVVKIVLVVAVIGIFPDFALFAAWTIPVGLSILLINALIFFRLLPRHASRSALDEQAVDRRAIFRFASGEAAARLISVAGVSVVPLVVQSHLGADATAYFTIAWLVAFTLPLLAAAISQALTVEGVLDQTRLAEYAARTIRYAGSLMVPASMVAFVFAPLILHLFGEEYRTGASSLLRLLIVGGLIHGLNNFALGVARVRAEIWLVLIGEASWSLVTVVLALLLVPVLGLTGAGWGYVVGQCVALTTMSVPVFIRSFAGRATPRSA
jgi:O-antigen/teichoic acid export membrane protein